MSIQITSPADGDTFPAGSEITVSGTGGPVSSVTVSAQGLSVAAAGGTPEEALAPGWTRIVGPLSAGTYTITVTAAKGTSDSVNITVG